MSPEATTEKGGETRRRIIEAARELFSERGYSGTSMNDLIAAAGLTKGGFYFHFASKRDVAIEVVRSGQEQLRVGVLAAAGEYERASEQTIAMVRALVASLESKRAGGMASLERLCTELRLEGVDDPAVVQPLAAWVVATAELFRRAQAEGDMSPDVDADAAAQLAVGSFCGLEELARGNPDSTEPLGITADEYLAFIGRAIQSDFHF
jgi:AcrR family transcriptional regulator